MHVDTPSRPANGEARGLSLMARHVSDAVAQWLPRVRHVIHKTDDRILVFGCLVRKNLDQTGKLKENKRLLFWESDKESRYVGAVIPADIRLVIRLHWASHPLTDSILKQARTRNLTVTDILLPSDVKYLLNAGFMTDEALRKSLENYSPKGVDAETLSIVKVSLEGEVFRMEEVTQPTATPPAGERKSLKPGELRAWLAPRANFEAARADRGAEAKRLIALANAERFPTTEGSIDTTLANMIRKMDTPEPAPLPPIPPPPAWSPTPKAPTVKTTFVPAIPVVNLDTPPEPEPATAAPAIAPREGSTISEVVQFIDSAIGALQTVREAVLKLPANMETEIKREVKRRIEARIIKAMEANEGDD